MPIRCAKGDVCATGGFGLSTLGLRFSLLPRCSRLATVVFLYALRRSDTDPSRYPFGLGKARSFRPSDSSPGRLQLPIWSATIALQ